MDETRWTQDESGQWWFRLAAGNRVRGELRNCQHCGTEFPYRKHGNAGTGQYCSRTCSNKAVKPRRMRRGADHPNWRGGRTEWSGGYIAVRIDGDYVLEHRHVMSQHVGRPLHAYETVHHKNGDKTDNRLENLELRVGRHGKGSTEAHCPTCTCFDE